VTKLRYDVASANAMSKILGLFASSQFTKAVGQTLVFDVSGRIGRDEDELRTQLARPRGKALSISAQVQSFGPPSLFLDQRWLFGLAVRDGVGRSGF